MLETKTTEYPEDKTGRYELVLMQLQGILEDETDLTANLANTAAILKEAFRWWWIGFYIVRGEELILGPFQGPVACTRIKHGKGVCGTAWRENKTIIVDDVHQFPGHIACSAFSNSEIVVPVMKNGVCAAVLDADSEYFSHFDETDRLFLEKICSSLANFF